MRRGQTDGVGKNLMLLPKTNLYNNKKEETNHHALKKSPPPKHSMWAPLRIFSLSFYGSTKRRREFQNTRRWKRAGKMWKEGAFHNSPLFRSIREWRPIWMKEEERKKKFLPLVPPPPGMFFSSSSSSSQPVAQQIKLLHSFDPKFFSSSSFRFDREISFFPPSFLFFQSRWKKNPF